MKKEEKTALLTYTESNGKQVEISMENFIIVYNNGFCFGGKRRTVNREDVWPLLGLYHALKEMIKQIEEGHPTICTLDDLANLAGAYQKPTANESGEDVLFKK